MKLRLVDKPAQNFTTSPKDIQYPGETWCVKTYHYLESTGGYKLWEEELNRVKPDYLYLYSVKTEPCILNGKDEVVHTIRAEMKKTTIKINVADYDISFPRPEKGDPNYEMDILYFTEKRDDALEHLNDGIKQNESKERIQKRLDWVLRVSRQLQMMKDAQIIFRTQRKK